MGKNRRGVTWAGLHILGMALMLCGSMGAALLPGEEWLAWLGRPAFPIFAFLAAEGYARTADLGRYIRRLLAWALLSEIPFDLLYGDRAFYPFRQNVLWTLVMGLLLCLLTDRVRRFRPALRAVLTAALALMGYTAGYAALSDYYGAGVLTVWMFHLFRERRWWRFLCQLLCLYVLQVQLLGGSHTEIALLALIPIWLYRGEQGRHGRRFRRVCYAFYPAHMLALFLIRRWMP